MVAVLSNTAKVGNMGRKVMEHGICTREVGKKRGLLASWPKFYRYRFLHWIQKYFAIRKRKNAPMLPAQLFSH